MRTFLGCVYIFAAKFVTLCQGASYTCNDKLVGGEVVRLERLGKVGSEVIEKVFSFWYKIGDGVL